MHRVLAASELAEVRELNGDSGRPPMTDGSGNAPQEKTNGVRNGPISGMVKIYQDRLRIRTISDFDVIDITGEVERSISRSGVREGYALVYCPHTTCAVLLNEKESGLLADINSVLTRLVPRADNYLHDDFDLRTENMQKDETKNAHAHLRQLLAGKTSEYIPISEGSLLLGQWQRVMFVEFDCSRDREALIQICGI